MSVGFTFHFQITSTSSWDSIVMNDTVQNNAAGKCGRWMLRGMMYCLLWLALGTGVTVSLQGVAVNTFRLTSRHVLGL